MTMTGARVLRLGGLSAFVLCLCVLWCTGCGSGGGGAATPTTVAGKWNVVGVLNDNSADDSVFANNGTYWSEGSVVPQGGTNQAPKPGATSTEVDTIVDNGDGTITLTGPQGAVKGTKTATGAHIEQQYPVDLAQYGIPGYKTIVGLKVDIYFHPGGLYGTKSITYTNFIQLTNAYIPAGGEDWAFTATPG